MQRALAHMRGGAGYFNFCVFSFVKWNLHLPVYLLVSGQMCMYTRKCLVNIIAKYNYDC